MTGNAAFAEMPGSARGRGRAASVSATAAGAIAPGTTVPATSGCLDFTALLAPGGPGEPAHSCGSPFGPPAAFASAVLPMRSASCNGAMKGSSLSTAIHGLPLGDLK
jgi:hypothetical protein